MVTDGLAALRVIDRSWATQALAVGLKGRMPIALEQGLKGCPARKHIMPKASVNMWEMRTATAYKGLLRPIAGFEAPLNGHKILLPLPHNTPNL